MTLDLVVLAIKIFLGAMVIGLLIIGAESSIDCQRTSNKYVPPPPPPRPPDPRVVTLAQMRAYDAHLKRQVQTKTTAVQKKEEAVQKLWGGGGGY